MVQAGIALQRRFSDRHMSQRDIPAGGHCAVSPDSGRDSVPVNYVRDGNGFADRKNTSPNQ